jgi:uncharacterized protein (TIGR01319 family)
MSAGSSLVYCVDFGSTFTKAALVDLVGGRLLASGSSRTTLDTDVLDGWDAVRAELQPVAGQLHIPVLACSSAGGGLRIAVVGNEELVTSEAGKRVALSSGGRVVHVSHDLVDVAVLRQSEPDVVLLVGGTDGGNADVLLGNAAALAQASWAGPVVVAGNVDAADGIRRTFTDRHVLHVVADNVVPRIGVLEPNSARDAIREVFISHVIGGKHLSQRTDFTEMVHGATPDVVLTAAGLLARGVDGEMPGAGDVVIVDVGGATTDVHSVVELDAEDASLGREVVPESPLSRTVEADLGMRWSAVSTVAAAREAGLLDSRLVIAAEARRDDPGMMAGSDDEARADVAIAMAAVTLAVRRHAGRQQVVWSPDGRLVERSGKDLRDVGLVIGSGGVLRHGTEDDARAVLSAATGDHVEGGWLVPRAPRLVVDHDYVLAAAGLLAAEHPVAAYRLLEPLWRDQAAG